MSILLISLPLSSSFILYFLGKHIGKKGTKLLSLLTIIGITSIGLKILINYNNIGMINKLIIKDWFNLSTLNISLELLLSKEGIIMINLINIITGIVIIYSWYYMKDESNLNKFLSYLFIFSISMSLLVLSNNFLTLFIGWEFVGLMSFLLINYWNTSFNSNKSAFKAILYNKIGDISFIIALILLYYYNNFNINLPFIETNNHFFHYLYFFFLLAAFAKSAQFIFHCWLSDAMAGPTPVSALLHAATMVTAGVYLLIKISINDYIINNWNREIIIIMGIITIIFSSMNSIINKDIKKIIAFSTCSQIGLMIINIGINYNSEYNSLFHLNNHGYFKALLFMTSGIIIHNLFNEQDIRKYGSLVLKFPFSYILFLVGTLTIIATPYLSGYYSKEIIIYNSYFFNNISIFLLLLFSSILTSYYSINVFFKTFIDLPSTSSIIFINNSKEIKSSISPELFIKKYSHLYYYLLFFILIFFSITIGYFTFSYINSPYNSEIIDHINYINIPIILKNIPFILIFFFIFFFLIYSFNSSFNSFFFFKLFSSYSNSLTSFSNFFSKKGHIDSLINYILVYPTLFFSHNIFFKIIEKGFLEFFGPVGLFRLFYYFPLKYNINSHHTDSNSLTYIFILLSLSFFLLIPFQFLT